MPTYHQSYTFNHKSRLNLQPSQKVTKGSKIISMGLWGGGLNHLEEMFNYFCAVMKVDESVLKQKRNGLSKDIFNKAIFDYMVENMTTHQEGSLLANKYTSGNFRECHSFHPFFKTNIVNLCQSLHVSPENDAAWKVFTGQKESYHNTVLNSGLVSGPEVYFTPEEVESNAENGTFPDQFTDADRSAFFESLPKDKIGVCIGVDRGEDIGQFVLPINQPSKLYLVDPWSKLKDIPEPEPVNSCWVSLVLLSWNFGNKEEKYSEAFDYGCVDAQVVQDIIPEENKDQVVLVEEFSSNASKQFDDKSLDWIHTDWSGEYTQKTDELIKWLPKIKDGGFLTGEVFCLESFHNPPTFSAVLEFMLICVANRQDLVEKHNNEKQDFIKSCYDFYARRASDVVMTVYSPPYAFGDVVVVFSFTGSDGERYDNIHYFQLKPSEEILNCLGDTGFIEYYPNCRSHGGSYKIKIGDWVSKNADKIKMLSDEVKNNETLNEYLEWRIS